MKNNKFCHLHLHNEYSVLDGLGSAEDYAKKASDLGFKYLGITNHGNIDGLIKFQKACKENNIHPILGCEAYIVPNLYKKEKGEHRGHVTLLVKNQNGFENLCKMLTKANLEGFYHRPRIDFDLLYDHCDGLVILTGCLDTFINLKGGVDLFYDLSEKLRDDLYLEVMPHEIPLQTKVNKMILNLFHDNNNRHKLVATNDCHYIEKQHSETQEVLLAIQSKAKWTDPNRWKFNITGLHLRTADEMIEAFTNQNILTDDDIDDAIYNTIEVAEKCAAFEIKKQKIFLPKVPGYNVKNTSDYLYDLCREKLKKIKKYALHEVYINRLETEFDLIEKKGFIPYFMIVYDLVKWCKENDIMVGPGRGSVGGSLMAYLLGITTVDPIRYNLLFSRFIAEDRNDLPDIDLDFEDSKRHLVRERLEELYGKNNISSISTFLSMKGKAAIRDVGRVFDVPLKDVDEFSKSIVYEEEKSIEEACIKTDIGRVFDQKYPEVCDHAIILEGTIRGNGQHAAAVIISADDLRKGTKGNLVNRNNIIVSNWDMEDSEYVGLMKLDVLGLNTLSILNETKRLIKTNHNVDIDYEKIPLDDQNIYKEISAGNNVGVFQINTWSTTKLAKEVSPDSIELLSDVIALVRPGSMDAGMTDEYIRRRNGKTWKKKHPIYEKIMESTYGVMVYQEQVMDVIHKVAGLPYTTADKIRKIIAKKHDVKLFAPFKKQFIEGCLEKKTLSEKEAKEFWEALQAHGKYSFNKSHATEYAIIGYWCAYVKYYYPTEFICANLIHGSETKKEELIEEAKRLGLKLVLPKVGISDAFRWVVKENKLYVPFIEIKGVGEKTAEACMNIKAKGSKKGFFESVQVQEKKTKIEKILEQIGAFGNEPTGDVEEYFTFTVNGRINHKKGYSKIFQKTLPVNERVLSCERCELCQECSSPVLPSPGYFNIMICGEAPGKDEDRLGKGFVGKSGQDVLWPALKEHGLKRSDFHITNICKCYPSQSKTPTREHITKCKRWLENEIEYLKPALILAFGNTGLKAFTNKESGIMDLNGKIEWNDKYQTYICWCIHPSAVLRNPSNKKLFVEAIDAFVNKIKELGGI